MEIILAGEEKQFLPLVDKDTITILENSGTYFLKLHHNGDWDYDGLYKIAGKENIKTRLQDLLNDFAPLNSSLLADLCEVLGI